MPITPRLRAKIERPNSTISGVTTKKADLIFASLPYRIMHAFQIPLYDKMRERDADFYAALEKAGLALGRNALCGQQNGRRQQGSFALLLGRSRAVGDPREAVRINDGRDDLEHLAQRIVVLRQHARGDRFDIGEDLQVIVGDRWPGQVAEGLAQRLRNGLVALDRGRALEARLPQAKGQRHDQQHRHRQRQQRLLPAQASDEPAFHRHHQKLPERARCRRHAHGPRALFGRNLPPQHAVNHRIGGARLGRANQHARRQCK